MNIDLDLGNKHDWWKASLILLAWAAAITYNWYLATQG